MVGVDHRPGAGELRRLRRVGRRLELLVAVDQRPDVFLELGQLAERGIDPLEIGDDLPLHCLALGVGAGLVEPERDRLELAPQRGNQRIAHAAQATAPVSASRSSELSSLRGVEHHDGAVGPGDDAADVLGGEAAHHGRRRR